jgi:phage terminase large subunit-like protein
MTSSFAAQLADALESSWSAVARPSQLPPPGDWWQIWLLLAGRGFGKTRTLAEWVCDQVASGQASRIALIAVTAADARDVLVEGESGILLVAPPWCRPVYEPSKRRLSWPNGAIATTFSAEEPERLRGPQHDAAVCDELGSWSHPGTWDMLQFGLRLGRNPRCVVAATTPRPAKLIRELLAREGRDVAVTRGSTYENRANLAPGFFDQVIRKYEGTRLGRQELDAELLEDTPGALWNHGIIDAARQVAAPSLARIVVAIDPAATSGEDAAETGIVVVGKDNQGHGYVLADGSGKYQPIEWAKIAIAAYRAHRADRIVAERNNGGAMVEATVRTVDNNIPVTTVWASRGKVTRAEPVSALYEQGRVHHVGTFSTLEDQMCAFAADFDLQRAGFSPDRVDALVWGITELLVEPMPSSGIFEYTRQLAEANKPKPRPAAQIRYAIGSVEWGREQAEKAAARDMPPGEESAKAVTDAGADVRERISNRIAQLRHP